MPDDSMRLLNAKPDEGSLELTEDLIRIRAYSFYEKRGCEHGHDVEDWLRAEAEIIGKKPAGAAEPEPTEDMGHAVAA